MWWAVYCFLSVGPRLRPQRSTGNIADDFQLRRHVRRHLVRFSVRQVRSKEGVRVCARAAGGHRQRHGCFTQLLRLYGAAFYRRGTRTGAHAPVSVGLVLILSSSALAELIKLITLSFWVHVKLFYLIVSYRIVSVISTNNMSFVIFSLILVQFSVSKICCLSVVSVSHLPCVQWRTSNLILHVPSHRRRCDGQTDRRTGILP